MSVFAAIAILDVFVIVVKITKGMIHGSLLGGVMFVIGLLYAMGYGEAGTAERWSTAALGIVSGVLITLVL